MFRSYRSNRKETSASTVLEWRKLFQKYIPGTRYGTLHEKRQKRTVQFWGLRFVCPRFGKVLGFAGTYIYIYKQRTANPSVAVWRPRPRVIFSPILGLPQQEGGGGSGVRFRISLCLHGKKNRAVPDEHTICGVRCHATRWTDFELLITL